MNLNLVHQTAKLDCIKKKKSLILNSMWILLEQSPIGIGIAYSPRSQRGPNYYSHQMKNKTNDYQSPNLFWTPLPLDSNYPKGFHA